MPTKDTESKTENFTLSANSCLVCGFTEAEILSLGKLGCASCAIAFESTIDRFLLSSNSDSFISKRDSDQTVELLDLPFTSSSQFHRVKSEISGFLQTSLNLESRGIPSSLRVRFARNFPNSLFPLHYNYRANFSKLANLPDLPNGWEILEEEEDQIRLIHLTPLGIGFAFPSLSEDWKRLLRNRKAWAFSSRFGFLTSCPTNLGRGDRWSIQWKEIPPILGKTEIWKYLAKLPNWIQVENLQGKPIFQSEQFPLGIGLSAKNLRGKKKILFFKFANQFQNLLEKIVVEIQEPRV